VTVYPGGRVRSLFSLIVAGIGVAAGVACIPLQDLGVIGPTIKPPSVVFTGATLVSTPSRQQLAAYYCPDVVSIPLGGAALVCQGLFGARPSPDTMAIAFDARLKIQNPNEIPLPLATMLAAVTVFPGSGNEQTGATCVLDCEHGRIAINTRHCSVRRPARESD